MIKKFYDLGIENSKYKKKLIKDLDKIISSGFYIIGKFVEKFEKKFSFFNKSKYSIGVGNGFDAIKISLLTLKIMKYCKDGDEVIVPANTYIATILPVNHCNLKPILIEPEKDGFNIDPEKIKKRITKKTKIIIVTHLYGHMCQMDKIMKIAKKYNLKVIEDCSQSHGAMLNNVKCGNFGDFGCFSLFPAKNLGALSDAGIITTNNKKFHDIVKSIRNYGENFFLNYEKRKYINQYKGLNSRMSEINGSILIHKLADLKKENNNKIKKALFYLKNITNKKIILPKIKDNSYPVWHQFIIMTKKRDKLKKILLKEKYDTKILYPVPPHKQKAYNEHKKLRLPLTEKVHSQNLSLPLSNHFTEKDLKKICQIINNFI